MINLRIQAPETKNPSLTPRIAVVGVGGAGGNAVNNMVDSGLDGVEFLVCNTDAQALSGSRATRRIQLGANVTAGLGAGAKPEVGRAAAEESLDELMTYIDGANMVFITAGMGGGTGTGAAPILAKACKDAGILTVGVVTKPFHFEGTMRMKSADAGIKEMQQYVDTLIVIPNQNLFRIATEKTTFADAFKLADEVLQSAVRGVTDLMVMPGLVNLDFNDIKTTMTEMGKAMMGTGQSAGDRRAVLAAEAAINNPLLDDVSMKGAKGVIINIAGGADMTLFEVDEACNRIREEVDADANIIFGTSFDESLGEALRVTVLATGIETEADRRARTDGARRFTDARSTQTTQTSGGQKAAAVAQQQQAVRTYASAPQPAPVMSEPDVAPIAAYVQGQAFIPPVAQEGDSYQSGTVPYSQIISGVAAPKVNAEPAYEPAPEPMAAPAPVQQQYQQPVEVYQQPAPMPAQPIAAAEAGIPDLAIPAGIVPTMTATHSPSQQARRAAAVQAAPAQSMAQTAYETMEPALSLFQRITSRVRKTVEASFEDTVADEPVYHQPMVRGGAQPAVTSQPIPAAAQAPVEVARPAKASPQAELDLDIPAFLRRQAS